ncbi:uncharacterized protein LOC135498759 [Lineus longissimus]|uniref:uncharacterized protein LOC135498759 n=1 Tax=Lineus longissimus TaxID=88925 RepID=UPI002B4E57FB
MTRIRHNIGLLGLVLMCLTLLVLTEGASIRHKRLPGKYPWSSYRWMGSDRSPRMDDEEWVASGPRLPRRPEVPRPDQVGGPITTRASPDVVNPQADEMDQNPFFSDW